MSLASLVGGVLYDAQDINAAARSLLLLLMQPTADDRSVEAAGLDPVLFAALRRNLPNDALSLASASALGAAWVEGRRSVPQQGEAELVVSYPSDMPLPEGVARTTGETLLGIFAQTRKTLRLTAPFITPPGIEILGEALVALVRRGVRAEIICRTPTGGAAVAWTKLRQIVEESADGEGELVLRSPPKDLAWPHLKVATSDGVRAYVGSANFTRPGLMGENIELGVLLIGASVQSIDYLIDQLISEVHL